MAFRFRFAFRENHCEIEVFNPFAFCVLFCSALFCIQVDYYTTESVVNVDWENGFVEASAKENENVNKVIYLIEY